jgi:hypothetical protein
LARLHELFPLECCSSLLPVEAVEEGVAREAAAAVVALSRTSLLLPLRRSLRLCFSRVRPCSMVQRVRIRMEIR